MVRILLVEDNPADARLIREYIEDGPCVTGNVSTPVLEHVPRLSQAIERIRENGYDIILLDLGLPDSTGLDTLRAVLETTRKVPVIVLTGHSGDDMASASLQTGAEDYLSKDGLTCDLLKRTMRHSMERRKLSLMMSESSQRFFRLINENSDAMVLIDREGSMVYANRSAGVLFGEPSEDLIGRPFDVPLNASTLDRIPFTNSSGDLRTVSMTITEMEDDPGTVLVTLRDITSANETLLALEESENRFKIMVDGMRDAVFLIDGRDRTIKDANPMALDLIGKDREDLIGSSILEVHPMSCAEEMEELLGLRTGTDDHTYDTEVVNRNGMRIPVNVSFNRLFLEGFPCIIGVYRNTTEKRLAELQLKEERDRARRYLNTAGVIMVVLDGEGKVKFINERGAETLGRDHMSVVGQHWVDAFVPEDRREGLLENARTLLSSNASNIRPYQSPLRTDTGEQRMIRWHTRIIRNGNGVVREILMSGEDITEAWEAEQKAARNMEDLEFLSRSSMRFVGMAEGEDIFEVTGELLSELGEDAILVITEIKEFGEGEGREGVAVVRYTHGFAPIYSRLFSLVRRDIVGMEFSLPNEILEYSLAGRCVELPSSLEVLDLGNVPRAVQRTAMKVMNIETIHTMGFVDGGRILGNAVLLMRKGASLQKRELFETFVNLASTAIGHRMIHDQVKEARDVTDNIIESAGDALIIHDLDGNVLKVNELAARQIGYAKAELQEMSVHEILPPEYTSIYTERVSELVEKGSLIFDIALKRPDGGVIPLEYSSRIVDHYGSPAVLSIARDITERKRAEHDLLSINEELRRSNEELEHFAHIASHDLQEPLRKLRNFTELLTRRIGDSLDQRSSKYMRYIVQSAQRMQDLIQDLLAYSRVGSGGRECEPIDCLPVLKEVVQRMGSVIDEAEARVEWGELPVVGGDRLLIAQLFQNLISNAIKFRRPGVPPVIRFDAAREGSNWHFQVRDNGIGMDMQYEEKVFTIFQRLHTREEYPGSGVGLAICSKIVARHGGRIWLDSAPGKGSTFHFTLHEEGGAHP